MKSFRGSLSLAAVLGVVLAAGPASAQSTGTTTGDIRGRVVDEKGVGLPGVSVTAFNLATALTRSDVTGTDGGYALALLPPGSYRVKAELSGFTPAQYEGVRVALGSTASLDVRMSLAKTVAETVTVTAESVLLDTSKTDVSETVGYREIQSLPNVARNFLSFSLTTPRVAEDRGPQSGAAATSGFSLNGQSPRYNNLAVDGMDNNDTATGGIRGTFSQDAVQEYQVVTNPYAAEYGRATGGVVNIVTRSGSNEFKGGAFFYYRSDSLSSKDPLTGSKIPLDDDRYGASLGGPLAKDRLFFFAAAERQSTDTANPVTITDADLALIRSKGFAIENGNVPYEVRNTNAIVKLDALLGAANTFTLRGNWSKGKDDNQQVWGGLIAKTAGGTRDNRDTSVAGSLTSVFGGSSFNEMRAMWSSYAYEVKPLDPTYGVSVTIPGVATFGTQRFLPQPRDSKVLQIFDAVSFQLGEPLRLKLGAEYDRFEISGSLPLNFAGLYRFSALPPNPLFPQGLSVRQAFAGNVPAVFAQAFGDPVNGDTASQIGAFLQLDWEPMPKLLLRAGVRYDRENPIAPFDSDSNVSPRLSGSWAPSESFRVKAGYGQFRGVSALGPMFAVAIQDGVRVKTLVRTIQGGPSPLVPWALPDRRFPNEAAAGASVVPLTVLRPGNFESARSDMTNLGVEFAPKNRFLISLEGVRTVGKNVFITHNVNPIVNPDAPAAGQRPDPRYSDIFLYESVGNSWYTAGTLGVQSRFGGLFEFSMFYTLAKAEDDYIDWLTEFQPQDPLNLADERGPTVQSPDQKLILTGILSTVGRKDLSWFARDWTFSLISDWRNGTHYNITAGVDRNRNGDPLSDRPAGVRRNSGNLGSQYSLDLRLARTIPIGGTVGLEVVATCTNVTDNENVLQRQSVANAPNFEAPTFIGPGRLFQIGGRISF